MHPKTRGNLGDITRITLSLIAKGALMSVGALAAGPRGALFLEKEFGGYTTVQIQRSIRDMRLRGYIEFDPDDIKSPFRITEKGLSRTRREEGVKRFAKLKSRRWDYLWRVVEFDIPERRKRMRDQFRNELRRLGFYQFQKSMYVTPFECEKEIEELKKIYRLRKYVHVGIMPNLGWRERIVRKWFREQETVRN